MSLLANGSILCGNGTRDSKMITNFIYKPGKRILDNDGRHCQFGC